MQRIDAKIRRVPAKDWSDALRMLESGEVDFVSGISWSEHRAALFDFTDAHLEFPVAMITRKEMRFLTTLASLSGRVVAVAKRYVTTEMLQRRYP